VVRRQTASWTETAFLRDYSREVALPLIHRLDADVVIYGIFDLLL
jgi:hypothetical protein